MRNSDWSSDVCSSDLPDKNALFGAAVQRAIERWIIPAEVLDALDPDDLEGTLTAVAGLRMRNANSADGLRLQHILSAESYRRSEEHTSELQSLMRISYAVFLLKQKKDQL